MARLSVKDLPQPAPPYRVDQCPIPPDDAMGYARDEFETILASTEEDEQRVRGCIGAASPLFEHRSAKKLARKLGRSKTPETLASSRFWRCFRMCMVGALWRLIEEGPWDHQVPGQVCVLSLAPRCWEFSPQRLNRKDARRLMAQFRTWLNRAGGSEADGFFVACLHGEWEPNSRTYRVHVHGVATGGMIAVLDELRKHGEFDISKDRAADNPHPSPRIVLSRKPIDNLPHALSYQFKGYWPSRWIGWVERLGRVKRARWGQRIAEPHHTELLLWMDRWSFQDITLLMNVRVGKQGLVLTPKASSRSKS